MHIVADVSRHVVIVDRVTHEPIETRVAIAEVFTAAKPAIGHIGKAIGHADADEHAIHFVRLVVFVGQPYTGTETLAGRGDPVLFVAVFLEIKAAISRGQFSLYGVARIKYGK